MKTQHGPKGPKGQKRYDKILGIAAKLINKRGYKGASLQEICNTAKMHKSTFFYYFKTKEELLNAILKKPVEAVIEAMEEVDKNNKLSPEEKLNHVIHNHLNLLTKYFDNLTIYNKDLRYLPLDERKSYLSGRKQYLYYVIKIIDEIKKKDSRRFKNMDSKIVALGILGMCNWTGLWYRKNGSLNSDDIANIFTRMLICPEQNLR